MSEMSPAVRRQVSGSVNCVAERGVVSRKARDGDGLGTKSPVTDLFLSLLPSFFLPSSFSFMVREAKGFIHLLLH